jgi:hypothetical protein
MVLYSVLLLFCVAESVICHSFFLSMDCFVIFGYSLRNSSRLLNPWAFASSSVMSAKICVINNGSIPITLSMSVGDWVPLIAQQYLTITWNYASGTVLQPGASQTVTITINVNQYVTGVNTFTNTIYVIAAQSS